MKKGQSIDLFFVSPCQDPLGFSIILVEDEPVAPAASIHPDRISLEHDLLFLARIQLNDMPYIYTKPYSVLVGVPIYYM
jgi:hypothetical protein